jgi:hypothetical protein
MTGGAEDSFSQEKKFVIDSEISERSRLRGHIIHAAGASIHESKITATVFPLFILEA